MTLHTAAMPPPLPEQDLAPEWLAHRYDPEHDAIHLLRADRALRGSAPFLTDEHLAPAGEPVVARRADVMATANAAAPLHFVLHSAYCCSTLLANAYDEPGLASSLKEPTILNDLVGWRHRGGAPAQIGEVLDSALSLFARPFEVGEAMVVKPSNVVNGLAAAMLSLRPDARAILLYAPLRMFLGSIAGKGLWGRLWVRDLLTKQLKDGLLDGLGFGPEDLFLQSDLQVAAVGWIAQQRLFAQLAERFPDRVRTLESETMLARPDEALAALDRHFALDRSEALRSETIARVFSRHAKFGSAFDKEGRAADQRSAAEIHGDEIDKTAVWAQSVADSAGAAFALPSPLISPAVEAARAV